MKRQLFAIACIAGLAACGDDDNDTPMEDTGLTDTTMTDTSMDDTTMTDTSMDDTSMDDTGQDVLPDVIGAVPRGPLNPPTLGVQVDRMGRPAVTSALVGTFLPTEDADPLKDAYNAASPDTWSDYVSDIMPSLAIIDALDTNCGNQLLADDANVDGRYAGLAGVLADDMLYVHSDRASCDTVYLGLEGEVVGALPENGGGCGGRGLDEDVIERSYSVLAIGELVGVDDTIVANDVPNSETFPYIAAPVSQ